VRSPLSSDRFQVHSPKEVRRFVARIPPVDSTTGSVCFPRSYSALEDQRAEILPVQRPLVLSAGGRCTMRLTRILMFPFFPLSILEQLPLHPRCLPKCPENFPGKLGKSTRNEPASQLSWKVEETKICHKDDLACAIAKAFMSHVGFTPKKKARRRRCAFNRCEARVKTGRRL
jgi:hypothetical protein